MLVHGLMVLLKYLLQTSSSLPNLQSSWLALSATNEEVKEVLENKSDAGGSAKSKRLPYQHFTPDTHWKRLSERGVTRAPLLFVNYLPVPRLRAFANIFSAKVKFHP